MSRSLAFVTILTIVGGAGIWSAVGQDETSQTSQGVVVKNHMSDTERDRLMQEAMESARRELEQKKALDQAEKESEAEAQQRKAEAAAASERATAAAEEERRKAAAEQKAREERLASELIEAEKQASEAKKTAGSNAKDLDRLEPLQSKSSESKSEEEARVKKAEKQTASKSSSEPERSSSDDKESKKSSSGKSAVVVTKAASKEEPAEEPKKAVIQTVSTRDPDAGLSVKTSMPVGDAERRAEQQAAASGRVHHNSETRSGGDMNLSGQVVGMMRSSGGPPRILVNCEDQRMVQVILERSGSEIPAAGSHVTISGRNVSGGHGRLVISAASVKVKSGQSIPAAPQAKAPQVVAAPPLPVLPAPVIGPPPPHVLGGMPHPPLPMLGGGPGLMLPPPPPF